MRTVVEWKSKNHVHEISAELGSKVLLTNSPKLL